MDKKKIGLIVDVEGWAFDIGAKLIVKELKDIYDFKIIYANEEKYNMSLFNILEELKEYDIIHFFWRKLLLQFDSQQFKNKLKENNIDYDNYIELFKNKISTGIHDHLFTDEDSIKEYKNVFSNYVKQYYTISKKLNDIYFNISEYKTPWGVIQDTFDKNLFYPQNLDRFKSENIYNRQLVIGWVGNSNWNIKYYDFKGFNTILLSTINKLISQGYDIKPDYADKNILSRTNNQMPEYYNNIDICICVSSEEGTPRPVLESMACGVPVITTDVGIVNEVLGNMQKEYIIGSRDNGKNDEIIINNLKDKIKYVYENRECLELLSKESYERSKLFDSTSLKQIYLNYFNDMLSN